ncbi:glycosyltransferase family 2 protein [Candidatus Woesearchaeota archaeon]|nr:glycosyltransferase family 2 protein [Candidatus Woesearchaeota archaeon]
MTQKHSNFQDLDSCLTKQPYISVIIPAHNEEKYIAKTLDSILSQDFDDYEIIVACDACTDRTAKIAKAYHGATVIEGTFGNAAAARNAGAAIAKGQVFAFIDADTYAMPDYLKKVAEAVSQGFTHGGVKYKAESKNLIGRFERASFNKDMEKTHTFGGICYMTRALFQAAEGFNEKLNKWEDSAMSEELREKGKYKFIKETYVTPSQRKQMAHTYGFLKSFVNTQINGSKYLFLKLIKGKKYFFGNRYRD